jgi:hypothetical protein
MAVRLLGFLIGIFILLLGVSTLAGGVYVGIWECLVSGIVTLIDQFKAPTPDSGAVAWAIVKIIFFELPLAIGIWGVILMGIGGTVTFASIKGQ